MKKFKILLLILCIFFININIVKADSLRCSYSYAFNRQSNLVITFEVIYDGSDIKIEKTISSAAYVTTTTNLPSKLQDTNIRDDNGKLSCPTFYAKTTINASGRNVNYDIDFSVNTKKDNYEKVVPFDSDIKDSSSSNPPSGGSSGGSSSGGSSSGSSGNSGGVKYTCVYSDAKKGNVFSFTINNNYKIVDYAGLGDYGGYTFTFNNKDNWSNCPEYIKVNACSNLSQYGGKLCNVEASDSSGDWFYNGSGVTTSGSDKDLIVRYLAYNNSKESAAQILKTENGYRVVANNSEITIRNQSDYTSTFTSYDVENYPTWIHSVEDESGKTIAYEFSNSRNELSKVNYICQAKILEVYGSSNSDPNETCLSLFGDDFLRFLNNNVFTIVRIAIPLLLIAFTTFDFAKVVFIDDKEGIQKAGKKFGKRLVAAILVFLIPQILIWLANIIGADKVNECAEWMQNNQSTITNISSDE